MTVERVEFERVIKSAATVPYKMMLIAVLGLLYFSFGFLGLGLVLFLRFFLLLFLGLSLLENRKKKKGLEGSICRGDLDWRRWQEEE